jgi:selT/selW/selH-like putative selenoprotein
LAAKLSSELGVEPELIRGDRGVFDVSVDGRVIFSKHSEGRFPREDEILQLLRSPA